MSTKPDPQPDSGGYIPLVAAGRKWMEYCPARDKIRIKSGGVTVYFSLADYRPKEPGR